MAKNLVGLKQEAEDFLKENILGDAVIEVFGEEFDLYKYELKDGNTVSETIQHIDEKDSSVFLYLICSDGRRLFKWTDGEISNA